MRVPAAITSEAAFELYAHLVEDNEQAVPILTVISKSGINAYVLEVNDGGIQPVLAALTVKLREEHDMPLAVMLFSEVWARGYEGPGDPREDPDAQEVSMDEAVIIAYADRAGNNWTALRVFVRTNEGVRWKEAPDELSEAGGAVNDLLNIMVGR